MKVSMSSCSYGSWLSCACPYWGFVWRISWRLIHCCLGRSSVYCWYRRNAKGWRCPVPSTVLNQDFCQKCSPGEPSFTVQQPHAWKLLSHSKEEGYASNSWPRCTHLPGENTIAPRCYRLTFVIKPDVESLPSLQAYCCVNDARCLDTPTGTAQCGKAACAFQKHTGMTTSLIVALNVMYSHCAQCMQQPWIDGNLYFAPMSSQHDLTKPGLRHMSSRRQDTLSEYNKEIYTDLQNARKSSPSLDLTKCCDGLGQWT